MTMDHGVQIKLLGPPALVCAPRAKRNRAECGGRHRAVWGRLGALGKANDPFSYRATAGI